MNESDFKAIFNGDTEALDDMKMFDIEQYLAWLNNKRSNENEHK